jgi:ADP-ribosylglycohydrolase
MDAQARAGEGQERGARGEDERRRAALLALRGTALGDGFGQAFLLGPEAPEQLVRRREAPLGPWRWSDDTMMATALTEVLIDHGRVDQDALARRFAERYVEQPGRGYGAVAHHILSKIAEGEPWQEARLVYRGQGSMGNGAAMRVAPAGAYFFHDSEQAVQAAIDSAEITHAHPEGKAGAVAVAAAAAWLRARQGQPWQADDLLAMVTEITPAGRVQDALRAAQRASGWAPADVAEVLGDGSQIIAFDTVPFSLWVVAHHGSTFEGALFAAMSGLLGHGADRDTICAIVGALVALRVGEEGLPPSWIKRCEPLLIS